MLRGCPAKKDPATTSHSIPQPGVLLALVLLVFSCIFGCIFSWLCLALLKVLLQQWFSKKEVGISWRKLQGWSMQQPDTPCHIVKLNKAKARKLCNGLRKPSSNVPVLLSHEKFPGCPTALLHYSEVPINYISSWNYARILYIVRPAFLLICNFKSVWPDQLAFWQL